MAMVFIQSEDKVIQILKFCALSFTTVIAIFFINLDRKYIYFVVIGLVILMPLLYSLHLLNYAKTIAVLWFFLFLIGVLKDIFYDKIYK